MCTTLESLLLDLGFYSKILGTFEDDGVFLGFIFSRKNLGMNLGYYRNCSVIFFVFVSIAYSYFFYLLSHRLGH